MSKISKALTLMTAAAFALPVFAEKVTHQFNVGWEAGDVRRVELEFPSSRVIVETAPIDQIRVNGIIRLEKRGDDEWRSEVMEGLSAKAIRDGNRLTIRESREGAARSFRARRLNTDWEFVVTVPEWTSVELRMTAGEVHMAGNLENVAIHMTAGEVYVEVPKEVVRTVLARARIGEVQADTGDRRESREGILAGAATYENEHGRTDIEIKVMVGEVHVKLEE